ncbi:MAG: CehA/McbA family metallohydrolase [Deltaproteobacteria bacterium]|nr:CehA/McbA family metallohydrolase [Deltaproteobacteria bacterium]
MQNKHPLLYILPVLVISLFTACPDNELGITPQTSPNLVATPQTALTVKEDSELIGGPGAQGTKGDVILSNDKIRVLLQKPAKNSGLNVFGGNIIDADRVRAPGEAGNDHFYALFPLVNIEWTINNFDYIVIADGKDGEAQILRASGMIDVYDYLDLDWIADASLAIIGQQINFADRFDDRRSPFQVDDTVKDMYPQVTTDFRLDPHANYVQIDTTFSNPSSHPISMPVGDFLVGGGELQMLIPGLGFSPPTVSQVGQNTPAIIFSAFPGGDVSYGYFYDIGSFKKPKDKEKPDAPDELYTTSSLSYSGVTGVLLGEEFLKILPLGNRATPDIHFVIPPETDRVLTRYFVVGDGSAGSVLDTGLQILKVPTATLTGQVVVASGAPIYGATVAVKKLGGGTIVTYVTDVNGRFHGLLPTGKGLVGQAFGSGKYEVWVEKEGYHENGTLRAGSCTPSQIDLTQIQGTQIVCTLGETGIVQISGGVTDETGMKIPSRLTIVGTDPSPETEGAGTFSDIGVFVKPFGIVDAKLINAAGGIGLKRGNSFELEPGTYHFVFSHGPEYSIVERDVTVQASSSISISGVVLKKVVATPGFVSADFHIHALPSPDSGFSLENRALAAAADGLDVLHSSDHDYLTDYRPVVAKLVSQGLLNSDSLQTVVGDEITPNHYGHIHAFPMTPDMEDPDHGALDWSLHSWDEVSPAADYCLSPGEIVEKALLDPGEEVIQLNHISDSVNGLPVATGWLTTPVYEKKFGIPPFVSYADPIERRLAAPANRAPTPPYTMESSGLIMDTFTAVELVIGPDVHGNQLWESALPTWFNLLNLGLTPTATGNSDSHQEVAVPLGMPRNFISSSVDPADGMGTSFTDIDEEVYAHSINEGHVVVSAGPYIAITATNENKEKAGVGDTISGKSITFDILVEAPDWAWFDTIEIYANTEPIPAEDNGRFAMRDEALSPSEFAKPYHVPRYVYDATQRFKLSDESLKEWKQKDGKISARLQITINVKEDTWVVIVAKGTQETEGYRSLFPIVANALVSPKEAPENFDPAKLSEFHKDKKVGAPAWAFTNPIFIDTDGDTDKDGNLFEAKWVREGYSKLRPFRQVVK